MHCETITIIYVISISVTPRIPLNSVVIFAINSHPLHLSQTKVNQYTSVQETYTTPLFLPYPFVFRFWIKCSFGSIFHSGILLHLINYTGKIIHEQVFFFLVIYLSQAPSPIYFDFFNYFIIKCVHINLKQLGNQIQYV